MEALITILLNGVNIALITAIVGRKKLYLAAVAAVPVIILSAMFFYNKPFYFIPAIEFIDILAVNITIPIILLCQMKRPNKNEKEDKQVQPACRNENGKGSSTR